jgi:hypothetical protein
MVLYYEKINRVGTSEAETDSSKSSQLQVTVPQGSLCNLNLRFEAGLPPDAVYNIIIDPENKRVFTNIKVCTDVLFFQN